MVAVWRTSFHELYSNKSTDVETYLHAMMRKNVFLVPYPGMTLLSNQRKVWTLNLITKLDNVIEPKLSDFDDPELQRQLYWGIDVAAEQVWTGTGKVWSNPDSAWLNYNLPYIKMASFDFEKAYAFARETAIALVGYNENDLIYKRIKLILDTYWNKHKGEPILLNQEIATNYINRHHELYPKKKIGTDPLVKPSLRRAKRVSHDFWKGNLMERQIADGQVILDEVQIRPGAINEGAPLYDPHNQFDAYMEAAQPVHPVRAAHEDRALNAMREAVARAQQAHQQAHPVPNAPVQWRAVYRINDLGNVEYVGDVRNNEQQAGEQPVPNNQANE